jgi:hypothetical protein
MFTVNSDEQFEKAKSPIEMYLFVITTLSRFLHPEKALELMLVTVAESVTLFRLSH